MTTTALAPAQAARAALEARAGLDVYAQHTADRGLATLARTALEQLAKGDAGPVVITDVDVLKVGTFNYGAVTLTAADLEAMVVRFYQLRDSGTFVPPIRLDHSWSILQVIGYVDELRTVQATDPTTGLETTYLRADWRITETDALGLIARGTAVNRSSEVGSYQTNAGQMFDLVFYGVALVDIPAVEGLAPITLSALPHDVRSLTADPRGTTMPEPEQTETGTDAADAPPVEELPVDDAEAGDGPATPEGTDGEQRADLGEDEVGGDEPDETGDVTDTGDHGGNGEPAPIVEQHEPDQALTAAERAELVALRGRQIDGTIAVLRERGAVNQRTDLDRVRSLLSRLPADDRGLLEELMRNVPQPVALGRPAGRSSLSRPPAGGTASPAVPEDETLGEFLSLTSDPEATPDEVGALWASLTREQRKGGSDASLAYQAWRTARTA